MSESCRSEGVILHRHPFSETSLILRVFTPHEGNVSLMARGARRKGSRLAGVVESLNVVEVLYRNRSGRDLFTLFDCSLLQHYSRLHTDLLGRATAQVMAEVLLRLVKGGDHDSFLYDMFLWHLQRLNDGIAKCSELALFLVSLADSLGLGLRSSSGHSLEEVVRSEASDVALFESSHELQQLKVYRAAELAAEQGWQNWSTLGSLELEVLNYLSSQLDVRSKIRSLQNLSIMRSLPPRPKGKLP